MKKEKQQSPVKGARKAIHERLLIEMKAIAAQLQKQGINIVHDLEKEAKKLAKKITKGAKVEHSATPAIVNRKPIAAEDRAMVKEKTAAKPKTTPKPQVAKTTKPVTPASTPKPAAAKPKTAKTLPQK